MLFQKPLPQLLSDLLSCHFHAVFLRRGFTLCGLAVQILLLLTGIAAAVHDEVKRIPALSFFFLILSRNDRFDDLFLGDILSNAIFFFQLALLGYAHGCLHEVTYHGIDISADITDFGKLRRLDLDKRRVHQLGEAARNLGLTTAGRSHHENVLRGDFFSHFLGKQTSPVAVSERDGYGFFRLLLSDDIFIQFRYDFFRRHTV